MIRLAPVEIYCQFDPVECIVAELEFPMFMTRDMTATTPEIAEWLALERIAQTDAEIDHALYFRVWNSLRMRHLMYDHHSLRGMCLIFSLSFQR